MKTMTEFIMEQEAPQVVEESFNEADLVSQFMALQAASANMSCILEFATIAEFCNENEIKMPESLVQEGFADVMDKIFTGIANFFQKIVDWFKGLVKGASATFSKAKIAELIAKLKTANFDGGKQAVLSAEISDKIRYVNATYKILWDFFVTFKNTLKDFADAATEGDLATKAETDLFEGIESYIADLKIFGTESKWYRSDGTVNADVFKSITNKADFNTAAGLDADGKNGQQVSIAAAIKILENINKYDIPKQSNQLLKEIDAADKKFMAIERVKTGTQEVDAVDDKGNPTKKTVDVTEARYKNDATAMRQFKTNIDKCAKLLATAYEKVTDKLTTVYAKALKDIETPNDKEGKEKYSKELENAKKDAARGRFKDAATTDTDV
jgi:hypothetical protein